MDIKITESELAYAQDIFKIIQTQFKSNIIGQSDILRSLIIGLLANGHILLEGVPGLAKTRSIKTIADTITADFNRIQFTPDLLPSDITGNQIFNPKDGSYTIKQGPIFTNILLADEINRAPAKVQSALLEAMQERNVTIGGQTFKLPKPFLVLATQNPIEQEGTYQLPEAQVDRFLIKTIVTYPTLQDELSILKLLEQNTSVSVDKQVHLEDIEKLQHIASNVFVDEKIKIYIANIIHATRYPEQYAKQNLNSVIAFGSSPRGSIAFLQAAKVIALMEGRGYVIPDDIKSVRYEILRHRILLTYEAQADGIAVEKVIDEILSAVAVP